MWTQTSDEEKERESEINKDIRKAIALPKTILGRKRLRDFRQFLFWLEIPCHIPLNSAAYTDQYCKKYGKIERKL